MPDTTETVTPSVEQFAAWANSALGELKSGKAYSHIVFVIGPDYREDGNWENPNYCTTWDFNGPYVPEEPAEGPLADAIRDYARTHPEVSEIHGDFYGLEVGEDPSEPAFEKEDDDFVVVDCPLEQAEVQEAEE